MKKEVFIRLDHFLQILIADRPLSRSIFLLESLLQHLRRRLQIDYEVRRWQLIAEMIVVTIVGIEFLIIEIQAGKQFVLLKNKIRDHSLLGPRPQVESLQLLKPPHQKCELRLKRRSALAF